MNFKLMRKSSNAALVTFHVVDGKDAVVGSINVPHSEVNNLLKHWKSAHTPAAAQRPGVKLKPLPPLSRQAILRSC